MRRRVRDVTLCVSVALLLGALALSSSVSAEPVIGERVRETAKAMSLGRDTDLVRPSVPLFAAEEPLDGLRGAESGNEYWVEKPTGQIGYFANREGYNHTSQGAIPEARMAAIAGHYAGQVYNPSRLARMERTIELRDEGEFSRYHVEYHERISGVLTFNRIRMTYTEDGVLQNCSVEDVDVNVSLQPKVDEQAAVASVASSVGIERWSSQTCDLAVIRDVRDGKQSLCWRIELKTGDPTFGASFWGTVDAITGVVVASGGTL